MDTIKKTENKIVFQDPLSLNAGQKYCRMLQGEHSAILSTFIKLPFVIKIFVLSIFEWPFYPGFTVLNRMQIIIVLIRQCGCPGWSPPLLFAYNEFSFFRHKAHIMYVSNQIYKEFTFMYGM